MVVPFAPGGPTDTVARVTAESMGRILGQTIVVENVAGAGGTIGSNRVVRADPDGHTILLHHLGLATAVALYRKLPFNPVTDLKPVGVVSDVNMAIIARPGYAPNTLSEVIADIKARGDQGDLRPFGPGCGVATLRHILHGRHQAESHRSPFPRWRSRHPGTARRSSGPRL